MKSLIHNYQGATAMRQSIATRAGNALRNMTMAATILTALIAVEASAGDFQRKALFDPSSFQLLAEGRGRVMIYDQMHNAAVETALNQQFDRIESMMFVRTRFVQPDGSIAEDDDCDD